MFLSAAFTGIYNAAGRSKTPFYISGTGLIMNIILDPLFIFGFGWGTVGAALATWLAEATVFGIFIYKLRYKDDLLGGFPFLTRLKKKYTRRIFKLGLPVATLNTLFAFVNMFLSRTASEQGGHIGLMAFYHRRTNRSHHTWNTSQGFSHRTKLFHCTKLCRRREVEGKESLVHYIMDDVHIRHTMFAAVYLFRKRGILYFRTRTGSISRRW